MSIHGIVRHLNLVGSPESHPAPIMSAEEQRRWLGEFIEANETADERAEALARQQEAAQAEYEASFDGRTQVFREGQPPDDVKAKTAGLPPSRATLVRYVAWVEREREELNRLLKAREAFFDAIGVPAVAEAELNQIKASDNAGYLRWILDGATKATQFTVDAFRRNQAEQRLSAATAEAEAARAGLVGIDDLIAFQEAAVGILEGRRDEFIRPVLIEAAQPIAREYEMAADRLADLARELGGAAHALHRRVDSIDRALPSFGFTDARVVVDEKDMKQASRRWTALEMALRNDPRASLEAR